MKTLALEFSSLHRSVALADETRILGTTSEESPRGANGMVLIDRTLSGTRTAPEEIQVLAVGLGPGSYAGIRSAIAIAQGWQLARDVRLVGVSSVEVIVAEAQQKGILGDVTVIIDAQRRELYAARFDISESSVKELEPLRIVPASALENHPRIIGPGAKDFITAASNIYPTAETLVRLTESRKDYLPGEKLEPIYLRETSFVKAAPPRFGG